MKIQVIGLTKLEHYNHPNIDLTTLAKPDSLDAYDINIIDFRDQDIWENRENSFNTINSKKDIVHLKNMIARSRKAIMIFICPQNIKYYYSVLAAGSYKNIIELKENIQGIESVIFEQLIPLGDSIRRLFHLHYENTTTELENSSVEANFCISIRAHPEIKVLTKSELSEKFTTVSYNRKIITTLNIPNNAEAIFNYLKLLGLIEVKQEKPEWFTAIEKFDDTNLKDEIDKASEKIHELKVKVESKNSKLEENNYYKSILYTSGEELVEPVFKMLEDMMNFSLEDFEDVCEEDFLIVKNEVAFVGEIKGISSNVKSENVGQVDINVQKYNDKYDEEGIAFITKGILIINHQRKKKPSEREAVHAKQIELAKRNGSLIILTADFLDLYEDFKTENITSDKIIKIFTEETGLYVHSK